MARRKLSVPTLLLFIHRESVIQVADSDLIRPPIGCLRLRPTPAPEANMKFAQEGWEIPGGATP